MVEENLADGSFSIADVARTEGITPRAIQKLFSRTGTTFSRYVLERRLVLAKSLILPRTPQLRSARSSTASVSTTCHISIAPSAVATEYARQTCAA